MRSARRRHQGAPDLAQSASVEARGVDGVEGPAVRFETGSQPRPRLCDQVLEPAHQAVAADMLEDHQPAAGCEHAPDLAEGGGPVVDRAHHQADVYRVETVVREWNRLAGPINDADRNAATASQPRGH